MTDQTLVCVADFEKKASEILEKSTYDYYRSGAGDEYSLSLNREAFRRLRLRPRCLRDVSNVSLEREILGQTVSWPLGISPSAMQRLAHDEGEVANARAAGEAGSIFILGTLATTSIEEVAEKAPNTTKWFQLYIYKDRTALTEKLVRRAERANFKAIVLTIDSPIFGQRRSEARNNFKLPDHLSLANFAHVGGGKGAENFNAYVLSQFDASVTWRDVEWLVKFTKLPVIVKGVLTAEDAVLAREYGCAGIIVSNHGARHLDYVPASIEALPEIVRAVGRDYLVMLDGGITQGNDMFKALALGAKMVFVGRSPLWGLACGGQQGVEQLLGILRKDFEMTMKLMGCAKLGDITPAMVAHESAYAKL